MDSKKLFVLVHSPLVGPLTWRLVASELRRRDEEILIPTLADSRPTGEPFWRAHVRSVSEALTQFPDHMPLILTGHSGAGPLLPAIRHAIPNPVHAYVFVDAGIPQDGATRLDLMRSEDPAWAEDFQTFLEEGGRFPTWNFDDLQAVIPDESLRREMIAELQPRGLDFFTEPIPVFEGWPDAHCVYIQFSAAYDHPAAQARRAGWQYHRLEAGHFHMLVDPERVAEVIIAAVNHTG
jgi:hypothetical protein